MDSDTAHTTRGDPSNVYLAEGNADKTPYRTRRSCRNHVLDSTKQIASSSQPAINPISLSKPTETSKASESNTLGQESFFKELTEGIFFSIELSSTEYAHGISLEDFKRHITKNLKKKVKAAQGAHFLMDHENVAKERVREWIAQRIADCKEEERAKLAKDELEKALDLMGGLHECLKKANNGGEALSGTACKRKIDQAVAQMDKAATVAKRIKQEDHEKQATSS